VVEKQGEKVDVRIKEVFSTQFDASSRLADLLLAESQLLIQPQLAKIKPKRPRGKAKKHHLHFVFDSPTSPQPFA
jgi:hypothetical protein